MLPSNLPRTARSETPALHGATAVLSVVHPLASDVDLKDHLGVPVVALASTAAELEVAPGHHMSTKSPWPNSRQLYTSSTSLLSDNKSVLLLTLPAVGGLA